MNEFQRTIGTTYYNQNYLNVGVAASNNLGNHNEPLQIILPNGQIIHSTINRTINKNGYVRFYGGVEWNQFIQANYNLHQVISFQVNNPNTISILPNAQ
ncbi:hypothetical protein [Flavobacterium sp.]|jgi:hypothetical protein|uniref:hypothetical protein n=1 Tax=Flavobacterium sp. TaxID=239 RepID=UPI0037C0C4D2